MGVDLLLFSAVPVVLRTTSKSTRVWIALATGERGSALPTASVPTTPLGTRPASSTTLRSQRAVRDSRDSNWSTLGMMWTNVSTRHNSVTVLVSIRQETMPVPALTGIFSLLMATAVLVSMQRVIHFTLIL